MNNLALFISTPSHVGESSQTLCLFNELAQNYFSDSNSTKSHL